jgi:divalent metal cation (Fe/Co/Zn/Cd) transporter
MTAHSLPVHAHGHGLVDASMTAIAQAIVFAASGSVALLAIFASACVAGYEAVDRLIDPREIEHVGPLAAAGAVGFAGNWIAAIVRTRAGRRLDSPALIADPLIGLAITLVILRITWQSWRTVRGGHHHPHEHA